jgi:hypothetical protein
MGPLLPSHAPLSLARSRSSRVSLPGVPGYSAALAGLALLVVIVTALTALASLSFASTSSTTTTTTAGSPLHATHATTSAAEQVDPPRTAEYRRHLTFDTRRHVNFAVTPLILSAAAYFSPSSSDSSPSSTTVAGKLLTATEYMDATTSTERAETHATEPRVERSGVEYQRHRRHLTFARTNIRRWDNPVSSGELVRTAGLKGFATSLSINYKEEGDEEEETEPAAEEYEEPAAADDEVGVESPADDGEVGIDNEIGIDDEDEGVGIGSNDDREERGIGNDDDPGAGGAQGVGGALGRD